MILSIFIWIFQKTFDRVSHQKKNKKSDIGIQGNLLLWIIYFYHTEGKECVMGYAQTGLKYPLEYPKVVFLGHYCLIILTCSREIQIFFGRIRILNMKKNKKWTITHKKSSLMCEQSPCSSHTY